ncbi:MAG: tetratricopeptide repeat protein [Patescibacteria group bacterium]
MNKKQQLVAYFDNLNLFFLGLFLVALPVLFLSTTTDAFVLPKQIALTVIVSLIAISFGIKTIIDGRLKLRASPFHLPVALFIFVSFLSAIFSVNRFDSLTAFVPLLFIGLLYFAFINIVKNQKQLLFILSALILGTVLSSILALFSFAKIYLLPFPYTHVQFFTTFGSLLDQALYLALILPMTGYFTYFFFSTMKGKRHAEAFATENKKNKTGGQAIFFSASFIIILFGLAITVYQLFTTQKPLILPFDLGLQTAFAAISQDAGNVLKSFLLGSGVGTYLIDFTRFKPALYNLNETLWSFTFFRSSSYILEILATTGIMGIASFLFLVFKIVKEDRSFFPILLAVLAALFLPFSFTLVMLFFVLLAIFALIRIQSNPDKYSEMDLYLMSLKKGFVVAVPEDERVSNAEKKHSKVLPVFFFLFLIVIIGIPMYFATRFFISDFIFQRSLVAASENKGLDTYQLQSAAIAVFPYRDVYYRAFSQTNLALANALAVNAQSQDAENQDPQVQQNIVTMIQQAISSARGATTVAPFTSFNWNNLSSVYRSLIGFGQNADQFAVVTLQQAIALDPSSPQQYVELGGIYYQLGQYDEAIRQFQIAIQLKNNYANAYYNLGHALEEKGDLQNALLAYQTVKNLVSNNEENSKKVDQDIAALQSKMEDQKAQQGNQTNTAPVDGEQQPLNVNQPSTTLPERDPQIKIPAPTVTIAPTGAAGKNTNTKTTPAPTQDR